MLGTRYDFNGSGRVRFLWRSFLWLCVDSLDQSLEAGGAGEGGAFNWIACHMPKIDPSTRFPLLLYLLLLFGSVWNISGIISSGLIISGCPRMRLPRPFTPEGLSFWFTACFGGICAIFLWLWRVRNAQKAKTAQGGSQEKTNVKKINRQQNKYEE